MPNLDFIARLFSKKAGLAALCAWLVFALVKEAPALAGAAQGIVLCAALTSLTFIAWKYLCVEGELDGRRNA